LHKEQNKTSKISPYKYETLLGRYTSMFVWPRIPLGKRVY